MLQMNTHPSSLAYPWNSWAKISSRYSSLGGNLLWYAFFPTFQHIYFSSFFPLELLDLFSSNASWGGKQDSPSAYQLPLLAISSWCSHAHDGCSTPFLRSLSPAWARSHPLALLQMIPSALYASFSLSLDHFCHALWDTNILQCAISYLNTNSLGFISPM
jgi:hypothetical protein